MRDEENQMQTVPDSKISRFLERAELTVTFISLIMSIAFLVISIYYRTHNVYTKDDLSKSIASMYTICDNSSQYDYNEIINCAVKDNDGNILGSICCDRFYDISCKFDCRNKMERLVYISGSLLNNNQHNNQHNIQHNIQHNNYYMLLGLALLIAPFTIFPIVFIILKKLF